MSGWSSSSFSRSELTSAEVDAAEELYGALTDDVRRVLDLTIRTRAGDDDVARARALLQEAAEVLGQDVIDGPAGHRYNDEGRSWNWGNTVIGVRNAFAPPVRLEWADDGSVGSAFTLGAAYEGPPGSVHGGVSALVLDHLMGETASNAHTRLTVTGTLTLRYLQPLPLGPVRMQARIAGEEGRKVTVTGWIAEDRPDATPAVEATGLFIVPRWASEPDVPAGIGSLD